MMKNTYIILFVLSLLLLVLLPLLFLSLRSHAHTAEPDIAGDLCVANLSSAAVEVNGFACKPAVAVRKTDFSSTALASPAAPNATMPFLVTPADVEEIPGLNTLGLSMIRIDFAPAGLDPPHSHPRATEMVFVLEGQLDVGFVTAANRLVAKTISRGEVFVFPRGLVHFHMNRAAAPAAVIATFDSQLPGTQFVGNALFAAAPSVPDGVLAEAFQISDEEVDEMKSRLAPTS